MSLPTLISLQNSFLSIVIIKANYLVALINLIINDVKQSTFSIKVSFYLFITLVFKNYIGDFDHELLKMLLINEFYSYFI